MGREPLDWRFDARGIVQSSSAIRSEIPWHSVVDVVEEAERFVFVITPYLMLALPKRFGREEDVQRLRELIDAVRRDGEIKGLPKTA